ncbi:MAG: acyl carrier protein [Pseudohongiella sp.]|jgi:acyl carrier protein|nr:acyl carrier protein [Pseudohongiella sp.]
MTTDVYAKLVSILTTHLPDADTTILADRSQALAELNLDSLSILEVIYELEEYFGFELTEPQLQELTTIDDLIRAFDSGVKPAA